MRDAVYLAVPAYPLRTSEERERALSRGAAFASALGLPLVASPLLDRIRPNGAWLEADARRADLVAGLGHRVLLAARGGYGCIDLVETLQRCGRATAVPLVVGYSDLTVLHAWWRRAGWGESLYGFLPAANAGERALATATRLADGDGAAYDAALGGATVRTGTGEGPLFAACLRVLAGLTGTPALPDLTGTILALEDIDERPYQMDRDLAQLHLAGALRGILGLVFGRFPCQRPADDAGPSAREVATTWARRLGVPAVFGIPFGHDPDPVALPCGRRASLRCDADGWSLTLAARTQS